MRYFQYSILALYKNEIPTVQDFYFEAEEMPSVDIVTYQVVRNNPMLSDPIVNATKVIGRDEYKSVLWAQLASNSWEINKFLKP